jgi:hypothetical protein
MIFFNVSENLLPVILVGNIAVHPFDLVFSVLAEFLHGLLDVVINGAYKYYSSLLCHTLGNCKTNPASATCNETHLSEVSLLCDFHFLFISQ